MSTYVGRPLNLYGLHDNVTAGVVLVKVLRSQTTWKRSIASYYQGLGSVRQRGLYPSTKALRAQRAGTCTGGMHRGWNPARTRGEARHADRGAPIGRSRTARLESSGRAEVLPLALAANGGQPSWTGLSRTR